MKRLLALALCALLALPSAADEITADQAAAAVGNWIRLGRDPTGALAGDVDDVETIVDAETGSTVHFVRLSGGGFVATSADDGIAPILAFSEAGDSAPEEGSPLWALLRARTLPRAPAAPTAADGEGPDVPGADASAAAEEEARMQWEELLGGVPDAAPCAEPEPCSAAPATTATGTALTEICVPPLVATHWGQTTHDNYRESDGGLPCYNYYTPARTDGYEGNMPCGCVATAGAQLMKYWGYPVRAAAATVACYVNGSPRSLAMTGGPYDWSAMPDDPSLGCGEAARQAIGTLTRDIGVAIGAAYGNWETSGDLDSLADVLESRFGYASPEIVWWDAFSPAAFRSVVVPNLEAGAPVVLSLSGGWSSHAVLADGYGFSGSSLCVHLNMGWTGTDDAWYIPPNTPTSDGTAYDAIAGAVFNVFPAAEGSLATVRVVGPNGRPVSGATCSVSPSGRLSAVRSDPAAGVFVFAGPAGTYTFTAAAGEKSGSATATTQAIQSDDGTGNVEVEVSISGLDSAGTVSISEALAESRLGGGCSVSSGTATCTAPVLATLAASVSGAAVRYTLDGTEPTAESALYGGPVLVDDSCTLRARAFQSGREAGASASRKYVFQYGTGDAFSKARPLVGASGSASFDNAGCTLQSGEPDHSPSGQYAAGASVWGVWKAPSSGTFTFELSGVDADGWDEMVMLAAYTGTKVSALQAVKKGENPDIGPARISFKATAGTVYRIAMASYEGRAARLGLRWTSGTFPFVEPALSRAFVSARASERSVGVSSSGGWTVADKPSWISAPASGGKNAPLVFSAARNATGRPRSGSIVLRVGDATATIAVQQSSLEWETGRAAALKAAQRASRPVLLVSGRDTCGNTRAVLFDSAEAAGTRSFIRDNYVLWFNNCDEQGGEPGSLLDGIDGYTLPFLAVFDPFSPGKAVRNRSGYASAADLLAFLKPLPSVVAFYTIAYKANGGTGKMSSQRATVGRKTTLRKNAFKRPGWVFAGWATTKSGAPAYKNRYSGTGLRTSAGTAPAPGSTLKLYARWARPTYQVSFKANRGKGAMAAQTFKYGKAAKLRKNTFKRKGWVFAGWGRKKSGPVVYRNRQKIPGTLSLKGKAVPLYAQWARKTYKVAFDANGGTGTMAAQKMKWDKSAPLRANAFSRPGFAFAGWAASPGGAVAYADAQSVKNLLRTGKTLVLYAVWTPAP